jgi:hypothetical protein
MSAVIEKKRHGRGDGGYDLLIERDAGNQVLILMGAGSYGKQAWKKLRKICDEVLKDLKARRN